MSFESRLMDEESELREAQKRAQGSRSWKWLRQGVSPGSLVPHLGVQLPMSVRTEMRRTILTTRPASRGRGIRGALEAGTAGVTSVFRTPVRL